MSAGCRATRLTRLLPRFTIHSNRDFQRPMMLKTNLLAVACGFFIGAYEATGVEPVSYRQGAEFTPVRTLGKEGVIVPKVFLLESGLPAEGFWTPKTSQLRKVERSLPRFLRKEMQSRPLGEQYRRQYVGMILNGRKVIWINCIPQKSENGVDPFANWNREISSSVRNRRQPNEAKRS